MNLLDAIILFAIGVAGYAGYRYGLAARALSWLGLTIGVVLGVLFVDDIANALQSSTPRTRLLGSVAFLFLVAVAGQTLGIAAGVVLRRRLPDGGILGAADRTAGAVAGVLGVLVAVWLLVPAFASAHGWPARAARGSAVARAVNKWAPEPPDSLETLGRLVRESPFPDVFDELQSHDVGSPPGATVPAEIAERVVRSVVKVEGRACDLIQQGSGFAAEDNLIVTNAHVVAGEAQTTVLTTDGRRLEATVVHFDPTLDIAVLRVDGLDLTALRRTDAEAGVTGAVFGFPLGGPLQESPARVAEQIVARGRDIYNGSESVRDVLVLAAALEPGDSGGALVDDSGRLIGVAFAVDPANQNSAYALTRREVEGSLRVTLDKGARTPVNTGPCLVG